MRLNDFVKYALAVKKISIKEAAEYLGYAEQSFRNKLSKGNFSLHDIIIISMLIDSSLTFCDKAGLSRYTFDKFDFLSDYDLKRLEPFILKDLQSKQYDNWFTSLPEETKQEIFDQHSTDGMLSGNKPIAFFEHGEGISFYAGRKSIYYISGKEHEQALQYIVEHKQAKKRMTEQEEKDLINETHDRFNVFIHEEEKPYIVKEEPKRIDKKD